MSPLRVIENVRFWQRRLVSEMPSGAIRHNMKCLYHCSPPTAVRLYPYRRGPPSQPPHRLRSPPSLPTPSCLERNGPVPGPRRSAVARMWCWYGLVVLCPAGPQSQCKTSARRSGWTRESAPELRWWTAPAAELEMKCGVFSRAF